MMAVMIARRKHWMDHFYQLVEWGSRALIAFGAAAVAFSLVPWLGLVKLLAIIGAGFVLYHLFGFLMSSVRLWCRVLLALAIGAAVIQISRVAPVAPEAPTPIVVAFWYGCVSFVLWGCFSIILDVLDLPRSDYLRDRMASLRDLRMTSPGH